MKTLRQVIKELQEFGERENALDLHCMYVFNDSEFGSTFDEAYTPTLMKYKDYKHSLKVNDKSGCWNLMENIGPIVVL